MNESLHHKLNFGLTLEQNHVKKKCGRYHEHRRGRSDIRQSRKCGEKSKNSKCLWHCKEGSGGNFDSVKCYNEKSEATEERVEGRERDGVQSDNQRENERCVNDDKHSP